MSQGSFRNLPRPYNDDNVFIGNIARTCLVEESSRPVHPDPSVAKLLVMLVPLHLIFEGKTYKFVKIASLAHLEAVCPSQPGQGLQTLLAGRRKNWKEEFVENKRL